MYVALYVYWHVDYVCTYLRTYVSTYVFLCFVERAFLYIHLKKNQLDAHFIFSIYRQTSLHVSGVSIAHHQEVPTQP